MEAACRSLQHLSQLSISQIVGRGGGRIRPIGDACEELTCVLRLPVGPLGTAPKDFRNLYLVAGAVVEPTMFIMLVEKRAFHGAALAVSSVMSQIVGAVTDTPHPPVLPAWKKWTSAVQGCPAGMNP